jgi:hypothetical protein
VTTCQSCKHSEGRQLWDAGRPINVVLWCSAFERRATRLCPGYEREAGADERDEENGL